MTLPHLHTKQWGAEGPEYASPVVLTVEGTEQIVTLTEKSIVAVSLSDGKLLWQLPFVPQRMSTNSATPVINGETVIYTGAGRWNELRREKNDYVCDWLVVLFPRFERKKR
ncbi:MAG: hypothetical protein ABIP48_18880 [Planctomycetota bacterium]